MSRAKRPTLFDVKPYTQKKVKPMLMAGNEKFQTFAPYFDLTADFSADASDIAASVCKFKKLANGSIVAFFMASSIQGLYKSDEHKPDKLYSLTLHTEEYEIWSSKEKAKVKVQPTEYEKTMIAYFNGEGVQYLEGLWSGFITLQPQAPVLDMVVKTSAWNVLLNLNPYEGELTLPEGAEGNGKRSYGGGGQKEIEKLNDRRQFLLAQIGLDPALTLLEAVVILQSDGVIEAKVNPVAKAIEMADRMIVA
jgi:hypothetical protein